jgi:hypothetical protein
MKNDEDYICRVCGLELEEPPWGDDSKSPTFEHCPYCGVEFGYGDAISEMWFNKVTKTIESAYPVVP